MIISDLHKFIFAAIPKTGTHAVRRAFEPDFDLLLCGRQEGERIAVMDGDDAAFDVQARGGGEGKGSDRRQ